MKLHSNQCYHIYNQGNNRQRIFFSDENYRFFLQKMHTYLLPHCFVMAYCLMPNHFHWLVYAKEAPTNRNHPLTNKIAILLRSYTRAINKQTNRSGSLFRQRTKAVHLDSLDYAQTCYHYIHQNPVRASLVTKMGNWPYSSFPDYACLRTGILPSTEFTFNYLAIGRSSFAKESKQILDAIMVEKLY